MNNIVGVIYENENRIEYVYTNNIDVEQDMKVIVETDKLDRFATVTTNVHPIDESKLTKNLNKISRIATKKDIKQNEQNIMDQKEALKKCKKLVEKYNLQMNVIDALYSFNRDQLMFTFYSDDRVDFRDLAKELASIYRTRIELHQIGVRDKAKKVGGMGLCGQELCCSRYMKDFDSVSISMAKNQNLSLNPTKINGVCGRLLCCLKYENECYIKARKNLPNVGQSIETQYGNGKVISVDILKKTYKVETDKGIVEIDGNN